MRDELQRSASAIALAPSSEREHERVRESQSERTSGGMDCSARQRGFANLEVTGAVPRNQAASAIAKLSRRIACTQRSSSVWFAQKNMASVKKTPLRDTAPDCALIACALIASHLSQSRTSTSSCP